MIWKMKRDEWAKPGKRPRMIADLGVSASLVGFRLLEMLKLAQSENDLNINGYTVHFCKSPQTSELSNVFKNLHNPPGKGYFVYFSDDACFARRVNGVVERYNLDISSCDSSHTEGIFNLLYQCIPPRFHSQLKILIDQCTSPLSLSSCVVGSKEKLLFYPTTPRLYSGSTITTAINNLANIVIAFQLATSEPSSVDMAKCIAETGYIVTGTEPLQSFHHLQFLKNSPVYDLQGRIRPMINLGVFLRASGVCKGDLPGRGCVVSRARAFQKSLIRSTFAHVDSPLLDVLKNTFSSAADIVYDHSIDSKHVTDLTFTTTDDILRERYSLNQIEIDELYKFARSPNFTILRGDSFNKILTMDYGLTV